jgi:hypothetical protein
MRKLKSFFDSLSAREKLVFVATGLISISLPLTVFVSLVLRDIRPKASSGIVISDPQDLVDKFNFSYDPETDTLTLVSKEKVSLLPEMLKEKGKTRGATTLTFSTKQTNRRGVPVYRIEKLVEAPPKGQKANFSITSLDETGTLEVKLPGSKQVEKFQTNE